MQLIKQWANWRPEAAPFIFDDDRKILKSSCSEQRIAKIDDWAAAYSEPDFGAPGDKRLHLGLLPHPFCGNLRAASVYVLLLNPGLGYQEYFGEYTVPGFREALERGLRHEFQSGEIPFLYLNPKYAWHGGFGWWHGKLAGVIAELARIWNIPFCDARVKLAKELASIELFPYHSRSFHDGCGWLRNLPSVKLAQHFVSEVVVPRVESGKAIVIVTRQAKLWGLTKQPGVILYSGTEARAAHLSPTSPGGRAIIKQLTKPRR